MPRTNRVAGGLYTLAVTILVTSLAVLFVSQVFWIVMLLVGLIVLLLASQTHRIATEREPRPYLALGDTEVESARMERFRKAAAMGLDWRPHPAVYGASVADTEVRYEEGSSYPGTVPAEAAASARPVSDVLEEAKAQGAPRIPHAWFARVLAVNNPPRELEAVTAEKTTARLTIRSEDGSTLGPVVGRWASSKQEHERERAGLELEHSEKDIEPNDLAEPIDVAMKYPEDEDCFLWNDENSQVPDGRLERHRLKGKTFLVDVVLKASNTPHVSRRYVLTNHGRNRSLSLEPAGSAEGDAPS
jgi:hypothetical protein